MSQKQLRHSTALKWTTACLTRRISTKLVCQGKVKENTIFSLMPPMHCLSSFEGPSTAKSSATSSSNIFYQFNGSDRGFDLFESGLRITGVAFRVHTPTMQEASRYDQHLTDVALSKVLFLRHSTVHAALVKSRFALIEVCHPSFLR